MSSGRIAVLFAAVLAAACFALPGELEAQCGGGGCGGCGGGAKGEAGTGGCGSDPSGGCDSGLPSRPSEAIGGLPTDSMDSTGTMRWIDSPGRAAPAVTSIYDGEKAPESRDILEMEKAVAELRPLLVFFTKRADPLDERKSAGAEAAACEALEAGLWKVLAVTERARDFACVRVDVRSADAALLKLHGVSKAPSVALYDLHRRRAAFYDSATIPPAQFCRILEAVAQKAEAEIVAMARAEDETPLALKARERAREFAQRDLCLEGLKALDQENFPAARKKFQEALALGSSGDWAGKCAAGLDETLMGQGLVKAEILFKAKRYDQAGELIETLIANHKKASWYGTRAAELLQQVYERQSR